MVKSKKERLRQGARQNFRTPHLRPIDVTVSEQDDPLKPLTVSLTLDELTYYDRNPRQAENEAFEEILNETRALGGLDGVLPVIRRPGEKLYFPKRGGNTRIRALKQLWEETGDESFFRIDCKVYPWSSEAEVLSAHLADNDNRGGVIFIDRALGVRNLRQELERETGEKLSGRALAEAMKGHGYAVSQPIISFMDYAIDVLLPLIPNILNQGLGKDRVADIRKLHNRLRQAWEAENPDTEEFESVFSDTLAESNDDDHWNLELVQQDLERNIADELGVSPAHLQVSLASIERGQGAIKSTPLSADPDSGLQTDPDTNLANEEPGLPNTGASSRDSRDDNLTPPDGSGPAGQHTSTSAPTSPNPSFYPAASGIPAPSDTEDIVELRARNYELARAAAIPERRLHDMIWKWNYGYGFATDIPTVVLTHANPDYVNPVDSVRARLLYTLLMGLSETHLNEDRIKGLPSAMSAVLQIGESNRRYLDFFQQYCPLPSFMSCGHYLFNSAEYLNDDQLQALFQIILNNRRIRELAGDPTGNSLFPPPTPDELLGLDPKANEKLFAMYYKAQEHGGYDDDES